MKGRSLLLIWSLGPVLWGCGGYTALKSQYDAYSPPPYYARNALPPQAPTAAGAGEGEINLQSDTPAGPNRDPQLQVELDRLAALKSRWRQLLTPGEGPQPVYVPETGLLSRLAPIAAETDALKRFLSQGFSLPELEILTLLRHPGIQAAQNKLAAALQGFDQVTQLDEILRQYGAFTEGIMPGVGPMKGSDPVGMKFPYPGITSLKGQVVNQGVKIARENLAIARRDALSEVRRAHWTLTFAVQAQVITREILALFDHLESVALTRYEAGSTSYQDVVTVRIERAILGEALTTYAQQRRSVSAGIRAMLDLAPQVPLGNPRGAPEGLEMPPVDELYALAREQRQELRRLRARIGQTERMIEMAETMILPTYASNLSLYPDQAVRQVGSAAMEESFGTTIRAEMGAGLPKLPWYGSQDAYLREIRQKLGALKAELRQAETTTDARVHQGWIKLDQARREVRLYRGTIVELSQTSLDVSTREYEAGKVSFADVIGSYSQWLNTRLALSRKQSDLGIVRAELAQLLGRDWTPLQTVK
ncbi:MAG: TolC family protein [Desulfobacterales bacterium]